jgi:long-chain acyl-CoA synthetase
MNIAKHLERGASLFADRPAVAERGMEITYRELNAMADSVAVNLERLSIGKGCRVGLCFPNSVHWLAFYFGALKLGATVVTFPPLLKPAELIEMIRYAKPQALFTTDGNLDLLKKIGKFDFLKVLLGPSEDLLWAQSGESRKGPRKALDMEPSDTAAVLFTGGTTGISKGVLLSHENITVSSCNVSYCERSTESDRALCFLPFNHVFGQIHIMNATFFSGGCIELMSSFDLERAMEILSLGKVTKFYAVPTIYVRMLGLNRLKERLAGVRYCFSAAASLASEIVREWRAATGLTIQEGYGLTETASAVTYNHMIRHRIGSVGQEVPGVEVQIRDLEGRPVGRGEEGEICIRGRNVMQGYLDHPQETEAAFWKGGWLRSGDIGLFDDDGYLFIVDRLKDMIITGGENVFPREVEELLYTRSEIRECAVLGLPDREWGERVTAFIVPREGSRVSHEDLKSFLKTRLAPYKIPKDFIVVDEIPKNSAGKPLKRQLREQFSVK